MRNDTGSPAGMDGGLAAVIAFHEISRPLYTLMGQVMCKIHVCTIGFHGSDGQQMFGFACRPKLHPTMYGFACRPKRHPTK